MKTLFAVLLIACHLLSFSQSIENQVEIPVAKIKKNELKVNFGMLLIKMPELTYERIIAKHHTLGISAGYSMINEATEGIKYMITPQYRIYFSDEPARGFFMELNASLYEERVNNYGYWFESYVASTRRTNVGLGIGMGGKFMTSDFWIGEVNLGIGSGLMHQSANTFNDYQFYPRIGFSVGKRF